MEDQHISPRTKRRCPGRWMTGQKRPSPCTTIEFPLAKIREVLEAQDSTYGNNSTHSLPYKDKLGLAVFGPVHPKPKPT